MIVEGKAFKSLHLLVVIDPAMSETARLAHYVLPAKCGYEKFEASIFPMGFPEIYMHLRHPVVEGPELARQECDIFLDILEKMDFDVSELLPFAMLKASREFGLTHTNKETGELEQIGVNTNQLISADRREPMPGNPMHKYNPCRIEKR